jgi:WD40 repeat protein
MARLWRPRDNSIRIWDIVSGKEIAILKDSPSGASSLAYSPDGATLAGAVSLPRNKENDLSLSGTVLLWDTKTYKMRAKLEGHAGVVTAVAFSPDGKTLAAASGEWDKKRKQFVSGEVRLWDPVTAKLRKTLKGHRYRVAALAFSPDGKSLATGSADWEKPDESDVLGEVKIWDVETAQVRVTSQVHNGTAVKSLAFSPDGKVLASGSDYLISFRPDGLGANGRGSSAGGRNPEAAWPSP